MDNQKIIEASKTLKIDTPPIFGKMTAQHMLEHLIITLKISSGRINLPVFQPSEDAIKQKQTLLETDMKFPRGIQAPGSDGTLTSLKLSNLKDAQQGFSDALEQFNQYFEINPEETPIHPRFGVLTGLEWKVFHEKHMEHHFLQFGITC